MPAGDEPAGELAAFVHRSMLDAYAAGDRMRDLVGEKDKGSNYPASDLAARLRVIAGLLKSGFGARVYYAQQPGYDTHLAQAGEHARLLGDLSDALLAFLDDLAGAKLADRVSLMVFSEFGRTIQENVSAGTDHGTAGPVVLAGPAVKAGIVGPMPRLLDPDPRHGDLRVGIDFRRVYATVLEDWLGLPARAALGADFAKVALFRA
jgi:uncharacterized protein (DUF1501 family)